MINRRTKDTHSFYTKIDQLYRCSYEDKKKLFIIKKKKRKGNLPNLISCYLYLHLESKNTTSTFICVVEICLTHARKYNTNLPNLFLVKYIYISKKKSTT